jgi:REP element-mobilizing transposase RayT
MRRARIRSSQPCAVYHCISGIIEGLPYLITEEMQHLRGLIDRVATFCGVKIITFSIMNTHFHLVVAVFQPTPITDQEILRRVEVLNGKNSRQAKLLRKDLETRGQFTPHLRESYLKRMNNISTFNQETKQSFTGWYNRKHDRSGPLWSGRFHSTVTLPQSDHALVMAVYNELNPVRAGIVQDPLHYLFCGYAEAMAGNQIIRENLIQHLGLGDNWEDVSKAYRVRLFVAGADPHLPDKVAIDPERIKKVVSEGGEVSLAERARVRMKHLHSGGAFGPPEFVREVHEENRKTVDHGRKHLQGPCPMKGKGWENFCSLWEPRGPH